LSLRFRGGEPTSLLPLACRGDYMFFFSSRRRHTRSKRDWSSDVCSSDLRPRQAALPPHRLHDGRRRGRQSHPHTASDVLLPLHEIGRATCRERVERGALGRRVEKKQGGEVYVTMSGM